MLVIEAVTNFPQIKVEEFVRYTVVRIEPMFGITPESLNAVNVIPALRLAVLFAHRDMFIMHRQRDIRLCRSLVSPIRTGDHGHLCTHL